MYDDEDNADDENNWRNDYPDEDPQYLEHWDRDCEYGKYYKVLLLVFNPRPYGMGYSHNLRRPVSLGMEHRASGSSTGQTHRWIFTKFSGYTGNALSHKNTKFGGGPYGKCDHKRAFFWLKTTKLGMGLFEDMGLWESVTGIYQM